MDGYNLDSYTVVKVFEIFRDRMLPIVNSYRRDDKDNEVHKHLFLAPSSYSKKRAFQVKGVLSPFICLWASSPLAYVKEFYSRSVLPQDFLYEVDGKERIDRGFLYDYEKSFELSSSSFFADFRAAVMQDLLDLDRLRYIDINVDELLPGYTCRIELMLENMVQTENVDQNAGNRSFDLGAKYHVKVTYPVLSKPELYVDRMRLYLESRMIWLRESTEFSPS